MVRLAVRVAEPPLRVGPVWADVPPSASAGSPAAEDEMVSLAALAVRHLAAVRGWRW